MERNVDKETQRLCTCLKCFEQYDEGEKRPKMLPCTHTLCHKCIQGLVPSVRCCSCLKVFPCSSADSFPVNVYVKHIFKLNTNMKRAGLQQQLEIQNLKSANNFLRESLQTMKTSGCLKNKEIATAAAGGNKRAADDSVPSNLLGLSDITFHTVHSLKSSRTAAHQSTTKSETIQVIISYLKGKTFNLEVSPFESVQSIKAKIATREGTPVDQQRLNCFGKQMMDGCSLIDYSIQNGSKIHLV